MNDELNLVSNERIGLLVVDTMNVAERDRSMLGQDMQDKKAFV